MYIDEKNTKTGNKLDKSKKNKARREKNRQKKYKRLHERTSSLHKIAYQVGQVISRHFPNIREHLSSITDPRKRRDYEIEELVFSCIMLFVLKSGSRHQLNQDRKTGNFRKNYKRLFKGLRLPHMDTVDEVLRQINPEEIEELKKFLVKELLERRVLHKFRLFKKYFAVAIDATGYASFEEEPYPGCTYRVSKNGKKTYYQPILEAKLVTSNGFSISLATQWVLNGEEYDKQDCELKAFKRLALQLKSDYPRLPICILADGLYPNQSVFAICQSNNWELAFTLKDTQLKDVQLQVAVFLKVDADNNRTEKQTINTQKSSKRVYRWVNDVEYEGYTLHWVDCVESHKNIETKQEEKNRFTYITSFEVTYENCIELVAGGRLRWKIENEGFNVQKNGGYQLEHKYSRGNLYAIQNYYQCMQIGHMINQLLQLSKSFKQLAQSFTLKHMWRVLIAFLFFGIVQTALINSKRTQFRYS